MIKESIFKWIVIIFLFLPISILGCSGGGSDATVVKSTSSQAIEVLPSSFDFGSVTPGNSPAPLVATIINNGSGPLGVTDIALSDTVNFVLDLSAGSNPCNAASSTIAAKSSCTVAITFQPTSNASFDANLTISSDDPVAPSIDVPLSGTREPISALTVRINQVDTCPGPVVTAYVSVTDQGGYPVTGLTTNDFSVTEVETGGYVGAPTNVSFVSNTATLSVALLMDYSGSITNVQDNVDDMQNAIIDFVNSMGNNDEAEIIKFDDLFEVVQPFTSDKNLLIAGINAPYDNGVNTALYDAVVKAVDDTSLRSKDRKAVIVVTDGKDDDGSGVQLSVNGLNDVINNANNSGIPISTVGLGQINSAVLQQMADDTGGQYYEATTSDNLINIYQQLADVLFENTYILTYTSGLGVGVTADLTIGATLQTTIVGDDTKSITSCP